MTIKVYTKCLANIYFDVFKENIPVYYKVYSVESAMRGGGEEGVGLSGYYNSHNSGIMDILRMGK